MTASPSSFEVASKTSAGHVGRCRIHAVSGGTADHRHDGTARRAELVQITATAERSESFQDGTRNGNQG
jgi:hypothetical protein